MIAHTCQPGELNLRIAETIRARYADGERPCDLAREYQVTAVHINSVLRGRAWTGKPPTRLNQQIADEIRARHAEGERQADLARAFDTTPAQVSAVVMGRIWTGQPHQLGRGKVRPPTPQTIAARCREIQATWDDETRRLRHVGPLPEWEPQMVAASLLD